MSSAPERSSSRSAKDPASYWNTSSGNLWVARAVREHTGAISEADARRFLAARKGDEAAATKLLAADLTWRAERKPESVTLADIEMVEKEGCWRFVDVSTRGHPFIWVQLSKWTPSNYTLDDYGASALPHITRRLSVPDH
jgi:hypothetical protein